MSKNYQAQLGHLASKLHLTDCHGIGLVEHHPNRLHTCDHHGNDRVVGIVDCQLQPASQVVLGGRVVNLVARLSLVIGVP